MPIKAKDFAIETRTREQVAKDAKPLQLRNPNHERHEAIRKQALAKVDRVANAADFRRRIEGRAYLVVDQCGPTFQKRSKDAGKRRIHVRGRHGAAVSGDADGTHVGVSSQRFDAWRFDEERGLHAAQRERFERVGRAGKVVGVAGQ
jgi:hypothetical protein